MNLYQCWYLRPDRQRGSLLILAADHESARCKAQDIINREFREISAGRDTVVTHVYRIGTVTLDEVIAREYDNYER